MQNNSKNNRKIESGRMERVRILFVDDERNILNSLNRLFFDEDYEVLLANSASDALDVMKTLDIHIIVSDQRMPKMTGVELLVEAKKLHPDSIRIILTGYSDIEAAQKAINEGDVFRFLTKPWDDDELKMVIHQAVELYNLQRENRLLFEENKRQNIELKALNESLNQRVKERTKTIFQKNQELLELNKKLSESFNKIVRIIIEIIEVKSRELSGHSKRVAVASRFIADDLNLSEEDIDNIEIAAMLHDIGKISLPESTMNKRENLMSVEEVNEWKRHPLVAERILADIDQLEVVRKIIRHHHENYNGTGFPDKLKGDEIPIGSRIIAVADTYDKHVNKIYLNVNNTRTRALKAIRLKMGTELDPDIVARLIQFLKLQRGKRPNRKEIELRPFELKENMILSRDLFTTRGVLVFPKDKRLDNGAIKTILDSERLEKLLTSVFVYD